MSDGGKIFKPHLRRAAVFATPMPGALLHRRRGQRTLARFGLPDMILRFILTAALLLVASAGGYWARRRNLADERLAEKLMTFVVAVGYSVIGFLSVWSIRLHASDLWLPVLGGAHVMLMIAVGFAAARFVTVDRSERALLALGVKPAAIRKLRDEVDAEVSQAIDAARADPEPVFADAFADVYASAGRH